MVKKRLNIFLFLHLYAIFMANTCPTKQTRALYHVWELRYLAAKKRIFFLNGLYFWRPLYTFPYFKFTELFPASTFHPLFPCLRLKRLWALMKTGHIAFWLPFPCTSHKIPYQQIVVVTVLYQQYSILWYFLFCTELGENKRQYLQYMYIALYIYSLVSAFSSPLSLTCVKFFARLSKFFFFK